MAWSDDVTDGHNEALADGAGVTITYGSETIPALQGSGDSLDQLTGGGFIESNNPTFSILLSDLATASWTPAQGEKFQVSGKTLKIKSISFDPSDPVLRIFTEGEEQ